jgi:hypothetical protein
MERLARRRRNQLGVEGAITVREVGVSPEMGVVTVVGIQIGGGTTIPGSLEELATDGDAMPPPKCAETVLAAAG